MKVMLKILPLMMTLAVFGADRSSKSMEELASHYADFLTNVTFRLAHFDVFDESLDSIRKNANYSPEAMSMALVPIVKRGIDSTNDYYRSMAVNAINTIGHLHLTNALSLLGELVLTAHGKIPYASFDAYGEITGHDERYMQLGQSAVKAKTLAKSYVSGQCCVLLSLDNRAATGEPIPERHRLQRKVRLKMSRLLINYDCENFEKYCGDEEVFARCIPGYTNSLEHVRVQRRINDFLVQRKEYILEKSVCRIIGKNRLISDKEWYCRATNGCQSEIARVMSLPEEERLNLTAILDAQIAAIEEAEARAARRAIWRRRLRNAALLLPVPVLVLIVIVLGRRKKQ